jgi:transposase
MGKTQKKTSLQETKRVRGKALLRAGVRIEKIPKATGLSMKTVQRLQTKRPQRKKGSGRKEILSRSSKISIRNLIYQNPFYTPADIVERLNLECSSETVRVYLKELGLTYRAPSRKEPLSEVEKNDRLQWCHDWEDFDHFDQVIYTDEAGIWLNDNRGKGWFLKGEPFIPVQVESREKINIWGAISQAGKVGIYTFRNNFNAGIFRDALREVLVPVAQELHPDGCYLQRDNSQAHRAESVYTYLNSEEADIIIDVLPWPSYSPDLNPIENLWAVLKRNIRKRQPRTIDQLEDMIHEEWGYISDGYVRTLCLSIHNRIDMCIENEGSRIDY